MFHGNNMFHGNDDYAFWGMHMFWWLFIIVIILAIFGLFNRYRKRK